MGFANQGFAQVRISQAYGAGGNSGATYKNDYVELYNAGSSLVSLSGYSIQFASSTGSTWTVINLSGNIQAKGYFLVAATAGANGASIPAADVTGSLNLAATSGKVALVSNTTALSGVNPSGGTTVVDLVGFGTGTTGYEGAGPAAAPSTSNAAFRKNNGETDSNDNAADFVAAAANPRNSASAVNPSIATSATSLNQFSATAGTASDVQSFTVLGFGLSTTIAVTPPAGFEISSNGINYSASLSLPAVGGTVSVRIPASATSGNSPAGNISLVSSPALSRAVAVSGAVTTANSPAVSCSPTALTGFSTYAGSVSTAQTITVSGTYLTDSVVVTAASGYEVSSDNITFSSSVPITQSGGTLGGTPVYVRVAATASVGALSGNAASVSSNGSPVVNVSGSGTVSTPSFGLLLSPNPVNEGASSTGIVSIPQARIADLVVSLASANTSAVVVPSSVTIPAGSTSATFQAVAVDNSSSYAETSSSISVSAAGVTGASVTLTVNNSTAAPITPIALDGSNSNSYSQNFNGLGINAVVKVFPASNGVQVSLGAITANTVNGWYGAKIAGTGTSATDLLANAGTTSTGTLYSFGNANDVNRAVGTIATGTTAMAFGALIRNDTGGTITNVKVSFTAEFWRNAIPSSSTGSAETNVLVFGYGKIDGTSNSVSNFLISSNALSQTNLNITGPAPVAYGTTPVNLDGSLPANQVQFSNVAVPLSLAAGEMAFVRWQDKDNAGLDAGIGLDNFVLSYEVNGISNSAPTQIGLSATAIAENSVVNTVVGTLSTTDSDVGDSFTYSLVSGTGDADNASFNISGGSLRASAAFDYETKSSYSIRVRTTDSGGGTFEKVFTITVTNVSDTIAEDQLNWLLESGLAFTPNLNWNSDPNSVGYSLATAYAFGLSAIVNSGAPTTIVSSPAGSLKIVYMQRNSISGIIYAVKSGTDLAAGLSGNDAIINVSANQPSPAISGYTRYEATYTPSAPATKAFLKVQAEVP